MGILTAIFIVIASALFGSHILVRTGLAPASNLRRLFIGFGVGVVILGYLVLGIGLLRLLTLPWALCVLLLMLAVGSRELSLIPMASSELRQHLAACWREGYGEKAGLIFIAVWLVLTLTVALLPPASNDWDGLSMHLAQAWTYAHDAAVRPLWFDHHSQFPSTMQMLYAVGMLSDGYVSARILHWLMGVLTMLLAAAIARRHMSPDGGYGPAVCAALVFTTTPILTWLTGVSYVDLAVCFFVLAALDRALAWQASSTPAHLFQTALMLGGAMAIKAQGIPIAGVIMFGALILTLRMKRPLRQWAISGALLIAVAGPWYLKSFILTGNPVYPFAYEIFGGKLWSQRQADDYEYHQLAFGWGQLPPPAAVRDMNFIKKHMLGPREPQKWLLGPIMLTIRPWEFVVNKDWVEVSLLNDWIGILYLPLLLLLIFWHRPSPVATIMWLFLPLWIFWFLMMQYTRYLIPSLVMLVPVAGYSLHRVISRPGIVRATGSTLTALWALWTLVPLTLTLYMASPALTGAASWDDYLTASLDVYAPSRYIAENLPDDAIIATYGEPRSYYFEKPAIWADAGHSQLIRYDKITTPAELITRYRELGITHVLLNRAYGADPAIATEGPLRLVQLAIDDGSLQLVRTFCRHDQYMLLRVEPPEAAIPADAEG